MRKKFLLVVCLTVAVFLGIFPGIPLALELQKAPLNPEFVEYQKRLETAASREEPFYGYVPAPVDLSHVKGPIFKGLQTAAYPSTYDLRNISGTSYVTPVRNQNPFGTCWAFGTLASLESTTLRNKQGLFTAATPDYSEWHLAYFAYVDQTTDLVAFTTDTPGFGDHPIFDQGGSVFQSTALLSRWTGAVNETDCPYWNTDATPPPTALPTGSEPRSRWLTSVILLGESETTPYVQDDVKYALTYYGACAIRFCVQGNMGATPDDYWNPATNSYYAASSASTGGHIVTIVGWDDTYPAGNFRTTPPGDGAWIVKNSWGTGWGDNGYFYLSYYDANIGYPAVFLGNNTTFEYIYQYDPLGWTNSYGYGSPTAYFANVFVAGTGSSASGPLKNAATEALKAISFYMATPGSSYNIWVYTGVTGSPATGTLAYGPEANVFTAPGYYTIILDEEIPLVPGEKFAVVVELTTPGHNWPIPVENLEVGYSDKARAHAGESYISANGTAWTDITTIAGHEDTNVALKAFTGTYTGPTVTPTGTPTITPTGTPLTPTRIPTPGGSSGGGGGCSALGLAPLGLLFLLPLLVLKK